jgi:hypothetical protein
MGRMKKQVRPPLTQKPVPPRAMDDDQLVRVTGGTTSPRDPSSGQTGG